MCTLILVSQTPDTISQEMVSFSLVDADDRGRVPT